MFYIFQVSFLKKFYFIILSDNKRAAEESSILPESKKIKAGKDGERSDVLVDEKPPQMPDDLTTSSIEGEATTFQKHAKKSTNEKGSFKEEPFTMISSNDPVVQSCLCVFFCAPLED